MSKDSNEKENEILDFVNREVQEKGYPPSVREICVAVGFKSTSTVHGYILKLIKNGKILKDPTKPRALKVLGKQGGFEKHNGDIYAQNDLVRVPIVGKVTAGMPILAVENIEDTFTLPVSFTGGQDTFILRVQGDSMVNAGILDKDFIVVRQQKTAVNGDIIVALIGDEATVKTFYKEKDHIRLQPENTSYEPILVRDDFSVMGKVTGVFRKL